jgi:hypothetical protein
MKPIGLTLLLFIYGLLSYGQIPVLDSANVAPHVGTNYQSTFDYPSSNPSAGADVTWNYSTVGAMGGGATIACFSNSYYPEDTLFPGANSSYHYGAADYRILESSGTSLKKWSHRSTSDNAYYLIEPEEILRFPFTYGDSYTDSWYGYYPWCQSGPCNTSATIGMPPTCKRRGTTNVQAIGYGTLLLPMGRTYINTLLVKTVVNYVDSNQTFSGLHVSTQSLSYYDWYLPGVHHPIAFMSFYTGYCGGFPTAHFAYLTNVPSNTTSLQSFDASGRYSIFPNPASGTVYYSQRDKAAIEIEEINVLTLLGAKITSCILNKEEGSIDVSGLNNGVYYIEFLHSKGERALLKLVVAK